MPEGSAHPRSQQARASFTLADAVTLSRVPLAAAFALTVAPVGRLVVLLLAAASDLLDGFLARTRGGSRWGPVLDPVADKVFVAVAVTVVAWAGALAWWEAVLVLVRDLGATVAFGIQWMLRAPRVIPARWAGKAVTACQFAVLFAFLVAPQWVRPLAWFTAGASLLAVWDYVRVAGRAIPTSTL